MLFILIAASAASASAALATEPTNYIGRTVALYNVAEQSFVRMAPVFSDETKHDSMRAPTHACTDMTKSRVVSDPPIASPWERFVVVDGGHNGTVGFWSTYMRRFIRMSPALGHLDISDVRVSATLPEEWPWVRFRLVRGGLSDDEVGLFNPTHERYVRMSPDTDYLESSPQGGLGLEPATSERFRIIVLADNFPPSPPPPSPDHHALDMCPRFSPFAVRFVVALALLALCAIAVAIVAICCVLKMKKAASKVASPVVAMTSMPFVVPPIPPLPAPTTAL